METKTANQLWRESGRQVPFKEFLEQRKRDGSFLAADGETFMLNKPVNDSIQKTLTEMQKKGAGIKPGLTKKYILGIPRPWFYGGLVVIVGAAVWYGYINKRK